QIVDLAHLAGVVRGDDEILVGEMACHRFFTAESAEERGDRRNILCASPRPPRWKFLSADRLLLERDELADALARESDELQEFGFREGRFLGRALDLDNAALAGEDEIGIGLGVGILGVVEVEHRRLLEYAA